MVHARPVSQSSRSHRRTRRALPNLHPTPAKYPNAPTAKCNTSTVSLLRNEIISTKVVGGADSSDEGCLYSSQNNNCSCTVHGGSQRVWLRAACQLHSSTHMWVCEHLPVQIIYAVLSVKGQRIPSEKFSPTSTARLPPQPLTAALKEEHPEAWGKVPGNRSSPSKANCFLSLSGRGLRRGSAETCTCHVCAPPLKQRVSPARCWGGSKPSQPADAELLADALLSCSNTTLSGD